MKTADFSFDLPADLIAQFPAAKRDQSRLLVYERDTGAITHHRFADLPQFVQPRDALVLNETAVMPARLIGRRKSSGGRVELLLIRPLPDDCWLAMGRPMRRLVAGERFVFGDGELEGEVTQRTAAGRIVLRFAGADVAGALDRLGMVPLPPYIDRPLEDEDRQRYQTVYARRPGAVAAPTAGLHFTPELLQGLEAQGTAVERLLLHVGPGTFAPVRAADPRDHVLEAEYYEVGAACAATLEERRRQGGRIVAVGTTAVRALETAAADGELRPGQGFTDAYIYPPYRFKAVDRLVTNFHLPGSSLLLLVAALIGRQALMEVYAKAIEQRYRFYSYGDAMLVL